MNEGTNVFKAVLSSDSTMLNGTFRSFQTFDLSGKAQSWEAWSHWGGDFWYPEERTSGKEDEKRALVSQLLLTAVPQDWGKELRELVLWWGAKLWHGANSQGRSNESFLTPKLLSGCSRVWMDKQLDLWKDFQRASHVPMEQLLKEMKMSDELGSWCT